LRAACGAMAAGGACRSPEVPGADITVRRWPAAGIAERPACPAAWKPSLSCKDRRSRGRPHRAGAAEWSNVSLPPSPSHEAGMAFGRLRRGSPCWRESSVAMWQAMSRTICISGRPRMDRDGHLLSRSLAATGAHAGTAQRRARLRFPPALPFRQRVWQRKDLCEDDQPSGEGRAGLLSRVDRRNRRDHVQVGPWQRRVSSAGRGAECAPDRPAARGGSHHNGVRPAYVRGAPC
jgi:hypothetical protein